MTMTARKLGTLTIGQAPRADITPILDAVIDAGTPRRHAGVLDGVSRAEIERDFAPRPGEAMLITKLLDGSSVIVDRSKTEAAAQAKLAMLEAEGCSTILMLCTGHFETLTCDRACLIEPDRILPPTVAALTHGARLGVIVPIPEQIASEAGKWAALGQEPLYGAASPYAEPSPALEHRSEKWNAVFGESRCPNNGPDHRPDDLAEAARDLARRGAQILLMDCMGFVESHRREAAEAAGLPVILSNSLIAKLVSEIV